jgi:iron complex outermembrane recepter protein
MARWLNSPALVALFMGYTLAAAQDAPTGSYDLEPVEVIDSAPIPGIGLPRERVPANVQSVPNAAIKRERPLSLGELLDAEIGSVNLNEAQGNVFQPDVNFRGFSTSPLLGSPQGLSVFQDGVRVNEGFGDLIHWDLIPPSAIDNVQVISGSNPVFGLNTLGGALAIHTKTGFRYPGYAVEGYGGSWRRRAVGFEAGDHSDNLHFFATGDFFKEHGWRDQAPSDVRRLFAKAGYRDDKTELNVSLNLADNRLDGALALPASWLDTPEQTYNWPEWISNELGFLNFEARRYLGDTRIIASNIYYRKLKTKTFASDINRHFDPNEGETAQAENNTGKIDQDGYGVTLQYTDSSKLADRDNQLTAGVSADLGEAEFTQEGQEAGFNDERGSVVGLTPFKLNTAAKSTNRYYGIYLTDTLSISPQWHLTLAGRYNHARIQISDRSGENPALDGTHNFRRFNPAIGVNFAPAAQFTVYANYNEAVRAPNPAELTCADPAVPCKLPTNFLADPPLKAVVARTAEVGSRGLFGTNARWSAALFQTDVKDDIRFVSSNGSPLAGFFQNVDKTRRRGVELGLKGEWAGFGLSANYSYLDATFESSFVENSPDNSSADADGNIHVEAGDRIPGIPKHNFKLRLDYAINERLSFGANLNAASSQYARGDENNLDRNGQVPGYAVLHLDGRLRIGRHWLLFAKLNNVFDKRYQNFGLLGRNFFAGPGRTFVDEADEAVSEQFRSPGTPRAIWVGFRYEFSRSAPHTAQR